MDPVHILLLPGSLRRGSTNVAVLRTAGAIAAPEVTTSLYRDAAALPHFNPDDDLEGGPVAASVAALRCEVRACDAILICTPEYAGALPASFKNVLEWTVGDACTYRKPVAWINASSPAAPTGGADAHESLRKVLTYVGADIVEEAVLRLPLSRQAVSADGTIGDGDMRRALDGSLKALTEHVHEVRERGAP